LKVKFFSVILVSIILCWHQANSQDLFKFRPATNIQVQTDVGTLPHAWAGGLNAAQYSTIDLDLDGTDDLFLFDRTTGKITTFINTGSQYQYQPEYEYLFPDELNSWVLLADYDCDGRKDIFSNTTFGMKVYRNTSADQLSFELIADPLMTESSGQMVNLQVGSSDLPALADVDGDGDLDILTFRFAIGNSIEYHQNQAMELNGNCSQMLFKMVDTRWGDFEECECEEYAFGEPCSQPGGRTQHAGGKSLLLFDQDHDGAMDLLFGDEFCTNIAYLANQGDADNALFNNAIADFPNATNPIDFFIFPGMFLEDVTFDGRKDLLASPNVFENFGLLVDFKNSSYLYVNDGVTGSEAFNTLRTDAFLQDQMIELGENASPGFMDIDGDGDQDLLVGNRGIRGNNGFVANITVYENIGLPDETGFKLSDPNYLGLEELRLSSLKPNFADIDGDGNKDLMFAAANSSGQTNVYYFLNQSSNGFEPAYSLPQTLDLIIQAGDHPFFQDLNDDGRADLLLGRRTGRLEYWINTSAGNNFSFELSSEAFAGIIDDSFRRELVPATADINLDGQLELITTDATGVMRVYSNITDEISSNNMERFDLLIQPEDNKPLVRSSWGRGSSVAVADLGGSLPHLVIGSRQGGLFLLENLSEPGDNPSDREFVLRVYPNPGERLVTLQANQNFIYSIYNSQGQLIMSDLPASTENQASFDSRILAPGIYIIRAIAPNGARDATRIIVIN